MTVNILLVLVPYCCMEFMAWFTHKYVMHGFMWYFHRDHHIKPDTWNSFFEKNDIFFLVYAIPAIILIISGLAANTSNLVLIGIGITLYGFTYFCIHDVMIHQRIPVLKNIRNFYLNALIKAHLAHHRPKNKIEFKCFGLLIFPLRYFK